MSLVRLSSISIIACVLALLALCLIGIWSLDRLYDRRDAMDDLIVLKGRADALSVASDNLLLFRPDPAIWRAFVDEAQAVRDKLLEPDDRQADARRAARQIEQLLESLESIHRQQSTSPPEPGVGPLGVPRRARITMNQVAGHGIAIDSAFEQLLAQRQQDINRETTRFVMTLALASAAFGLFCIFAFSWMYRRLAGPTRALSLTIQQLRQGDRSARAAVSGRDEFAELSRTFNQLLEEQQQSERTIQQQETELAGQSRMLTIAGRVARFGGWSLDLHTRVVHWSDMVAEIHGTDPGYSPPVEQAISFYAPEHQPIISDAFNDCATHGTPFDKELQIIRVGGEPCWIRTTGVAVRDEHGQLVRVEGAFQDINERRTLELRLEAAQRMEAIGQLTGGISHDFNNILTVILGNADLLTEELANAPAQRASAERIAQSAQRGAELTHQLLAFARRQPLDPAPVDINAFIDDMRDLLQRTLGGPVRVELALAPALWPALVDGSQLESAVLNLAINARDAMPDGGTLLIETGNAVLEPDYAAAHVDVTAGEYVRLSVSDNGSGIPAEDLERLFEPFFTTKQEGKGTGLGLPMVYGFIKQSRGHIKVYSEPDAGTTINLYLRRAQADSASDPATPADPASPIRGGHERILVVEDDPMVRDFAVRRLERLGYAVVTADSGQQALDVLIAGKAVDLLFTDVIMPGGLDGAQLADRARRLRPDLPILFTSGYTENAAILHGRLDPGRQLLQKPYRTADLAGKLRQMLS